MGTSSASTLALTGATEEPALTTERKLFKAFSAEDFCQDIKRVTLQRENILAPCAVREVEELPPSHEISSESSMIEDSQDYVRVM